MDISLLVAEEFIGYLVGKMLTRSNWIFPIALKLTELIITILACQHSSELIFDKEVVIQIAYIIWLKPLNLSICSSSSVLGLVAFVSNSFRNEFLTGNVKQAKSRTAAEFNIREKCF